jgi:hypothetical protein
MIHGFIIATSHGRLKIVVYNTPRAAGGRMILNLIQIDDSIFSGQ